MAILALVLIYAASFAIRITHGFSKTIDSPDYTVRLQILNGCGADGAANRVARALDGLIHLPLETKIVDVDNFDSYTVEKSFIIARESDLTAAELLAEQLGLDKDDIIYEAIENNYRSITATLVLGSNFDKALLQPSKQREN